MTSKKREDFKKEETLQAVVIADSFNVRFAPITHLKPRALLPLVNVPLLEYTLQCLSTSGIQEVIVFCCIHADQIRDYITNSKWNNESSPMEVIIVVSEGCMSVGDALRDIDAKSLISNDFVLVNGDMISNVNLKPLIERHKQRRLKEKTPIMTMLFKKAPPDHKTRCKEEDVIMAVEKGSDRILHYQKVATNNRFEFPLDLFDGKAEVELRFDLLDTHISLCSPHVPQLFTDEFDYLTRDDFVRGILVNEEILGNTIHIHVLEEEYAARVSNLHMYDAISKDVLSRWSYPMVPDKNITELPKDKYSLARHNIYLHKDVILARGCILEENVLIGKGSSVGCNTKISHSVIGKNVTIGENVQISGAYIWDGCTIGDNCCINMCLLDYDVKIKDNVTIQSGCVIARNVKVGPSVVLKQCTYLMASQPSDDDFGEDNVSEPSYVDPTLIGSEGMGYKYEVEEDEEVEEMTQDLWGVRPESDIDLSTDSGVSDGEDSSGSGNMEGSDEEREEKKEDDMEPEDDSIMFYSEIIGVLRRGLEENIGADNLILEINSAKSAYGIYIKEVNLSLTKAIFEFPLTDKPDMSYTQYFTQLKTNFKKFLPLLQNYIKSEDSQKDLLTSLEDICSTYDAILKCLAKILHYFYEQVDLLGEDVILQWYGSRDTGTKVRKDPQLAKFIQWLEEAEEETDSEEG